MCVSVCVCVCVLVCVRVCSPSSGQSMKEYPSSSERRLTMREGRACSGGTRCRRFTALRNLCKEWNASRGVAQCVCEGWGLWCVCATCSESNTYLYEDKRVYTTSFQVARAAYLIKRLVCVVLCVLHVAVM